VNKIIRVIFLFSAPGFLVFMMATRDPVRTSHEPAAHSPGRQASGELIVFHAGSLAVPFKQICEQFNEYYPGIKIFREAAGSRVCAYKITKLNRLCDVMASADYTVIDSLLIPEHADWNIKFAGNEIVIAYRADSRRASQINKDNWYTILLEEEVAFGRSDPNLDPCGYRTALVLALAEEFYNKPGLASSILAKDTRYIRPKEVDLLMLLEVGNLDYIFIYRSVAEQHKLKELLLPEQINLSSTQFAGSYKNASVRITGKRPHAFITKVGEPVVYSVTIPKNAPNRKIALAFLKFLLDPDKGGAILKSNGHTVRGPSTTDTFEKLPECLKDFALPVEQESNR